MNNELKLSVDNCYHNDWVIFEGEKHQIHSTCPEFPFLKDARFGLGVVTWDNIKPIALTPEILDKIGLKKWGKGSTRYEHLEGCYNIDNTRFYCRFNDDNKLDILFFDTDDYGNLLSTIEHLHTFQQLIRLFTGKEIDIKCES